VRTLCALQEMQVQEVLEIALTGMQRDMVRLERVANNFANVTTPGYKREVAMPAARPFVDHMDAATPALPDVQVMTDTRAGTLKATGQPLDLALAGDGYFEVATADGVAYTRLGSFRLDAQGRLVNIAGQSVMGKGGEIRLSGLNPSVDSAGRITESGRVVDQIRVVGFARPAALVRLGQGLFGDSSLAGEGVVMADAEIRLHQGFIENGNVNALQEMIELTRTVRHFESMHKLAQGYDEMIGMALRKMGES